MGWPFAAVLTWFFVVAGSLFVIVGGNVQQRVLTQQMNAQQLWQPAKRPVLIWWLLIALAAERAPQG